MIVYKIDKQPQASASKQIRDMSVVLKEIGPTLEILLETIAQHKASLSSPSIDDFRDELEQTIRETIETANAISENSLKLCNVSDQASKHLIAIEEHFGSVLREGSDRQPVHV